MKSKLLLLIMACMLGSFNCVSASVARKIAFSDEYTVQVIFPGNFQIGNYIEFLKVSPYAAGASGYYEISIAYTRESIASAATYLASVSHANPSLWREVGRTNSNGYVTPGSDHHNFTIDCNTESANPRFRIRAINTGGGVGHNLPVDIKVRSINFNSAWTALNVTGTDLTVNKVLPMTNDWSLYVGNTFLAEGAHIAIKATENGNVGIGTTTPNAKLAVNGNIRAKEVKVENTNWPDFVFANSYVLPTLKETEAHIKEKGHLPGIPSAADVKTNGVDLGDMNAKLLQKIEELTMHLIEQNKQMQKVLKDYEIQSREIQELKSKIK